MNARSSPAGRSLECVALACLALGALARAQEGPPPSDSEGALANDTFLPVSTAASQKLAAGDAAFARWRAASANAPTGDATGPRNEAFDAWRAALSVSDAGECVPGTLTEADETTRGLWADVDASLARRTEAVECALLRRLAAIEAADLGAWCERFAALAKRDLAAAGADEARLTRVERQHPCSAAAADAAVRLFDLAFESGRSEIAAGWLARAAVHAHGLERAGRRAEATERLAAVDRRTVTLTALRPATRMREAWETANRLALVATLPWSPEVEPPHSPTASDPRPGAVFLADGTCVVQGADRIHCIAPDGTRRSFDPARLVRDNDRTWVPVTGRRALDWPLSPATDGRRLVLVAGRAERARGNSLLCVDPGDERVGASLVWSYAQSGWRDPLNRDVALEACLGPGLWSFEPGPVVVGTEVIVQARQWLAQAEEDATVDEGKTRAWCVAFDVSSGAVRWKRLLATGSDARADPTLLARLRAARGLVGWAQPIGRSREHLFVGTELGAGVLIDLCDGRPSWSVKSQRRAPAVRGWNTTQPPVQVRAIDGAIDWLWAPADSAFLYRLRDGADSDAAGLFRARPLPIGDMDELIGGGPSEVLALARSGGRRTLTRVDTQSGQREDSFLLGREEFFTGAGLASDERVLFATNRALYLVDRGGGLRLLQSVSLEGGRDAIGGSVFAHGDRVYVVHARTLSILRVE